MKTSENEAKNGPTFTYTVDGDPRTTTEHQLTPRQILTEAGLDPSERFLIEVKGKEQESFSDRMDTPIHIHQHQKFITAFIGVVPVS